ncbi:MAG TPA: NAD-dependent epimerase/dehydratase family protein [Burkholderiaceae bacterium]
MNPDVTLVTGSAGFIGHAVCAALLSRGEAVVGLDNFNPYYDPSLKRARVERVRRIAGGGHFEQAEADLADRCAVDALLARLRPQRIVHLAAQAGVRYSFEHPEAYVQSNLVGFFNLLEAARRDGGIQHVVYASSSSVYGGNRKVPFSTTDRVDDPISLYAATKRAGELMAQVYALQFGLKLTGLRYFTVYGPWGRPDMAPVKFARALLEDRPIEVYGHGAMQRDFTYIDDIVAGTLAALDDTGHFGAIPHRLYNLGNSHPEALMRFIETLGRIAGKTPQLQMQPMQPGDVKTTSADIEATTHDLGWRPTTSIEAGLPPMFEWCRSYYGAAA